MGIVSYKSDYLKNLSEDELWSLHDKNPMVKVSFFDGEQTMRWRYVVYSWYFWRYHRTYDRLKLSVNHLIDNRPMDDDTDNNLLNRLKRALYEVYGEREFPKDTVGKVTYSVINDLHEITNTRCEEYFTMLSITDCMWLAEYPPIKEAISAAEPNRVSIEEMYAKLTDIVYNDPALAHSQLAVSIRQGATNVKQWLEFSALRGFITEINDRLFPTPNMASHLRGTINPIDRLKDSRTSTKSLASNKIPLEQSEYQGRRLRMLAMNVKKIVPGDCGSRNYVKIAVTKENLRHIDGVWRKDGNGNEVMTWADDKDLIGQVIEIRNPVGCNHGDVVCERCYGLLHCSVPDNTNIGWSCAMQFSEKISQGTLSLKHLAFNPVAKILRYMLDENEEYHPLINHDKDPQHFYLRDESHTRYQVGIALDEIPVLSDFEDIELSPETDLKGVTEITNVTFVDYTESIVEPFVETIGTKKAPSAFTVEFLAYARHKGTTVSGKHMYIDLKDWDTTKPMFIQAMRAENNLDMVQRLRWVFEGNNNSKTTRDADLDVQSAIESGERVMDQHDRSRALAVFYDSVSYKIPLHVSVMGVMLKAVSCVDPEANDYRMASGSERYIARSLNEKMLGGSCGALLGYQNLKRWVTTTKSFNAKAVGDHPMDVFLTGEINDRGAH